MRERDYLNEVCLNAINKAIPQDDKLAVIGSLGNGIMRQRAGIDATAL